MTTKVENIKQRINEMTEYVGYKQVLAMPLNRADYNELRGWELPADENGEDEGYLVQYFGSKPNTDFASGYITWSPKAPFLRAYRRVDEGVSYSHALHLAKHGKRIARKGWNGKNMYVFLVDGESIKNAIGDCYSGPNEVYHDVNDFMMLKGVDGRLSTWVPSSTDQLAEDWVVV